MLTESIRKPQWKGNRTSYLRNMPATASGHCLGADVSSCHWFIVIKLGFESIMNEVSKRCLEHSLFCKYDRLCLQRYIGFATFTRRYWQWAPWSWHLVYNASEAVHSRCGCVKHWSQQYILVPLLAHVDIFWPAWNVCGQKMKVSSCFIFVVFLKITWYFLSKFWSAGS